MFDPRYLIEAIAALDSEQVTLNLIDNLAPLTVTTEGEAWIAVVMPMRLS